MKNFLKYDFKKNFSVKNIPRSDVLELSFVSTNPKISQLALISIIDSIKDMKLIKNSNNKLCKSKNFRKIKRISCSNGCSSKKIVKL